jgi:hypothetical protein
LVCKYQCRASKYRQLGRRHCLPHLHALPEAAGGAGIQPVLTLAAALGVPSADLDEPALSSERLPKPLSRRLVASRGPLQPRAQSARDTSRLQCVRVGGG